MRRDRWLSRIGRGDVHRRGLERGRRRQTHGLFDTRVSGRRQATCGSTARNITRPDRSSPIGSTSAPPTRRTRGSASWWRANAPGVEILDDWDGIGQSPDRERHRDLHPHAPIEASRYHQGGHAFRLCPRLLPACPTRHHRGNRPGLGQRTRRRPWPGAPEPTPMRQPRVRARIRRCLPGGGPGPRRRLCGGRHRAQGRRSRAAGRGQRETDPDCFRRQPIASSRSSKARRPRASSSTLFYRPQRSLSTRLAPRRSKRDAGSRSALAQRAHAPPPTIPASTRSESSATMPSTAQSAAGHSGASAEADPQTRQISRSSRPTSRITRSAESA